MSAKVVAVLVSAFLAGCAGASSDTEADDPIAPTTPRPGAVAGGGEAANSTTDERVPRDTANSTQYVESESPPDPFLLEPEFHGCLHAFTDTPVDAEAAEQSIPPEFSHRGLIPTTASLHLAAYRCEAVVIDNATVAKDVAFAFLALSVSPPERLRNDPMWHQFILASWASDEKVLQLFSDASLPIQTAGGIHLGATVHGPGISVEADDSWQIAGSPTGPIYEEDDPLGFGVRYFYGTSEELYFFDFDANLTSMEPTPRIGTWEYRDEAMRPLLGNAEGSTEAMLQDLAGTWRADFARA